MFSLVGIKMVRLNKLFSKPCGQFKNQSLLYLMGPKPGILKRCEVQNSQPLTLDNFNSLECF